MRVLFAGTPDFSVPVLQALYEQHEVVGVYTQPDRKAGRGKKLTAPPVKELANKLELEVFQPENFKDQDARIAAFKADVMVVVAYGMLLPKSVLDIPKYGCINIHASILPRWRGAAPIQRAIEAGDSETGVSIMQMAEGLDTGDVFEIFKTPISDNDNAQSVHDRLSGLGAKGILSTLSRLEAEPDFIAQEQDHESANYAKKLLKSEGQIDWQQSAQEIFNKIRAFNPWPVCFTEYQGERVRIWQAQLPNDARDESELPAGTICSADSSGITVATGKGQIVLTNLQRQGAKALPSREFLQGFSLNVRDVFDAPE